MADREFIGNSIDGMAASVLATVEGDVVLVGCSLGGIVALAVHRLAPTRVRGIALISTTARPPREEQRAQWHDWAAQAPQDLDGVVSSLLPTLLRPRASAPELEITVREMAHEVGPRRYVSQLTAQQSRVDERPGLEKAKIPVLVIAAENDPLCPPVLHEEMAALADQSTLVIVPDCGHLSPIDRPNAIRDAVRDWLPCTFSA